MSGTDTFLSKETTEHNYRTGGKQEDNEQKGLRTTHSDF